ncbi:MAG: hypothetical protein HOE90_04410 [Bacteriovoracaceae bacterium]|nr:hypothetical protein [Bacteriovoracaceae bacterium]
MSVHNFEYYKQKGKSLDEINFYLMDIKDLSLTELIEERFIRLFRVSISNLLRNVVDLKVSSKSKTSLEEFKQNSSGTHFYLIGKSEVLKGPMIFQFETSLGRGIIHHLLGGENITFKECDTEFTQIELSVMKVVYEKLLVDFNEAWSPIKKLDVGHLRFEINSKFIGIVSDDEPCLELEIELNFCQSSGKMRILIPFQTLYPIRERLF